MDSLETRSLDEVRGQVDFGIITMREDEFTAVLQRFRPRWLVFGKAHFNIAVLESRLGRSFTVAIVRTASQGHAAAQTAATALYTDLDPSCFVLIGIAGAKPEPEFTLGDVIVGTRFYDFSVGAALPKNRVERVTAGAPLHHLVQTAAVNLPAVQALLGNWNTEAAIGRPVPPVVLAAKNFKGDKAWKEKVRSSLSSQFQPEGPQRPRLVTAGALASGNILMKDPALFQRWLEPARDIKGVEMELPGVSEAVRSVLGDRPVLPIRGFSDVIGFQRDPGWTEYACHSAASFAHAFLTADLLNIEPKPKTQQRTARISGAGAAAILPAAPSGTARLRPTANLVRGTADADDAAPLDVPCGDHPVVRRTAKPVDAALPTRSTTATTPAHRKAPVAPVPADAGRIEVPPLALAISQVEVLPHEDGVLWAEFSPDGTRIVTASKDGTARLWDSDGAELATLRGNKPDHGLRHAAFSPDGTRVVTASGGGAARVWDAARGSEIVALTGHRDTVGDAAFSPDSRRIVTASYDKTATVWDAASGRIIATMAPDEGWVICARFSPDGHRVATASLGGAGRDGTVRVWDAVSGQQIAMLRGHQDTLWHVAFRPDGGQIATGSIGGSPRLWDAVNYRRRMILGPGLGNILQVDYSPDGSRLLTAGPSGTCVWNAATGEAVARLDGGVEQAAFSPNGKLVATADKGATARVCDVDTGRCLATLRGHEGNVMSAMFSPDGSRLVTASMDGTALIWLITV